MRLALLVVCVAGAAAAPLQPEDCPSFTATPDSTVDSAWCESMCKAGNCPPTLCQCAGAAAEGQAAPAAAVVADGTVVPAVPAALGEEAVKVEKEVKVDMKGEKNLPFDKAIIGYYGAGPYTPSPFEGTYGDKGPSIADALVAGYNVICLAFADSFTGDGGFQVHTDLCPVDKDHKQLKESGRKSNPEGHLTLQTCSEAEPVFSPRPDSRHTTTSARPTKRPSARTQASPNKHGSIFCPSAARPDRGPR